ncbi:MAG: hypothetical protein ACK5LY_09680 [Lachnospirales bacterium]
MRELKKIKIKFKNIGSPFCNKCGDEIKKDLYGYYNSHFKSSFRWQYPSKFDNEVHSFKLCENCYEEFIESFKIPPKR